MADSSITVQETVFLTDNGSLRPEATFGLRKLAGEVSRLSGRQVEPVSLLHSSKIDSERLGGIPAETFERAIKQRYEAGQRRFRILPLFFGPSGALVDYIPQRVEKLEETRPDLEVTVAPCLAGERYQRLDAIAEILAEGIRQTIQANQLKQPQVALIDHGTPLKTVSAIRKALGNRLSNKLAGEISTLFTCAMERREGAEYAFNDPLLENLLASDAIADGGLILSYLFFFPGRHAGPGGDIADIVADAVKERPGIQVYHTPLAAELPGLAELLVEGL